jgi:hypothetical protein
MGALEAENQKLQGRFRDYESQIEKSEGNEELLAAHKAGSKRTSKLQKQVEDLERRKADFERFDEVQSILDAEKDVARALHEKIQELETKDEQLKHLDEILESLEEKARSKKLTETKERFKKYGQDIGRELSARHPLYIVGVWIRLRYLVHAKGKLFGMVPDDGDAAVLRLGNRVAHSRDGEADEALYEALCRSGELGEMFGLSRFIVFDELYGKRPGKFRDYPKGLQKAKDNEATIRVVQLANRGTLATDLRASFTSIMAEVQAVYEDDSNKAEEDASVRQQIKRLEQVADEIVNTERGK